MKPIEVLKYSRFEPEMERVCLKNLRDGDKFYECEAGKNFELTAMGKPMKRDDGWTILARGEDHVIHELFMSSNTNYRMNLFMDPVYVGDFEPIY